MGAGQIEERVYAEIEEGGGSVQELEMRDIGQPANEEVPTEGMAKQEVEEGV